MDNIEDAKTLCQMMIKIAENCTSNLTIQQYVFLRVEEILGITGEVDSIETTSKRALYFATQDFNAPYEPFLRGLKSADASVQKSAATGLAALLAYLEGPISVLLDWIYSQFDAAAIESLLPPLCLLMRKASARNAFAQDPTTNTRPNGIHLVVAQLYKLGMNGNAQLLYELTFILWTLSLQKETTNPTAFLSSGAIRILADLLASAPSRKVVRMALATLHNLAALENEGVLTEMLTSGQ